MKGKVNLDEWLRVFMKCFPEFEVRVCVRENYLTGDRLLKKKRTKLRLITKMDAIKKTSSSSKTT